MNKVCYLLKGTVHDLLSREKFEAIRELVDKVSGKDEIRKIKNLVTAVIEREREQCTGIGEGVAIAHGKTKYARTPLLFLGVSRQGIDYDAPDGKPVQLLFIITNHPDYQEEYLYLLSSVARLMSNVHFRENLLSLEHATEIENTLLRELECLSN